MTVWCPLNCKHIVITNNKYTKKIIVAQSPILMYDLRNFLIKDVILALKTSLIVTYQNRSFEEQKI